MNASKQIETGVEGRRRRQGVPKPRRVKVDTQRAQEASRRLIMGVCRGLGRLWDRQEALQQNARSRGEAMEAARPLLEVCQACPIVNECRIWAIEDSYTGVAAGSVWHEGHEHSWLAGRKWNSLDEAS